MIVQEETVPANGASILFLNKKHKYIICIIALLLICMNRLKITNQTFYRDLFENYLDKTDNKLRKQKSESDMGVELTS